jgi:hypothetical protein
LNECDFGAMRLGKIEMLFSLFLRTFLVSILSEHIIMSAEHTVISEFRLKEVDAQRGPFSVIEFSLKLGQHERTDYKNASELVDCMRQWLGEEQFRSYLDVDQVVDLDSLIDYMINEGREAIYEHCSWGWFYVIEGGRLFE